MNIYPMEERRIGIKSCSLSEIFLKWGSEVQLLFKKWRTKVALIDHRQS